MTWVSDFVSKSPQRIVSTVPSQTELLFDLGLSEQIVGVTKYCVHPKDIPAKVHRIGGTKSLNIQAIQQLQPDLIIANKEENEKDEILALAKDFPVWVSDIPHIERALESILELGEICDVQQQATHLYAAIKKEEESLRNHTFQRKNTLYLIWRKPWLSVGGDTYIHSMMDACGFNNILQNTLRYPEVDWALVGNSGCEIVLLSSEPYAFQEKHIQEIKEMLPEVEVCLVDGEMFSWYGSRMLKAFKYFHGLRSEV